MKHPTLPLFLATATVASVLSGAVVAPPAHAAVTATTSGTTMNVALTGNDGVITFVCSGGNAAVRNSQFGTTAVASPTLACGALTQVNVSGSPQSDAVDGRGLDDAVFGSPRPRLNVTLGEGNDTVWETLQVDNLVTGDGHDTVHLQLGTEANVAITMGTNTTGGLGDQVLLQGPDTHDTFEVTSNSDIATLAYNAPGKASTWTVSGVERIEVRGGKGNDHLSAAGVVHPAPSRSYTFHGEEGNDTLKPVFNSGASDLYGGPGANTYHLATHTSATRVYSESETDTVSGTGNAGGTISDQGSPRSGGRTLVGLGTPGSNPVIHRSVGTDNDEVVRIRPGATAGAAVRTHSLDRRGQQQIPAGIGQLEAWSTPGTMIAVQHRFLGDVVVPAQDVTMWGPNGSIYDITVPTGSWTEAVSGGTRTIVTGNASLGDVKFAFAATYKVHGPWANKNQGFAHRAYRDLLLRFASDATRDQVRDQLANGSRTRTQVARGLVFSDEYRGLDVDRVFVRFLKRVTDPSGRTYWIGSLRNGKSMRQFRAQLFGSNEYFTKAGGTNAKFVERAYLDVMGRKPDPSGLAYWTKKADNGVERGLIARQFLSSTEARRSIVQDQFLRFLDRLPTTAEADQWLKTLGSSPTGEQDLIVFLTASGAYYNRS